LEPLGDGTKFTYVVDAELPWGIFGKGLGKLMHGQGEKGVEKSIKELKSILEK